jgi:cytidine kinase
MLESRGVCLNGVERSESESFTWSGEYHANMNERTTHRVGLNVLENWQVKVPAAAAAPIVVLANMSPDNQIEMLTQCGIVSAPGRRNRASWWPIPWTCGSRSPTAACTRCCRTWICSCSTRARRATGGCSNLVRAGRILLEKGPRHVVVKLGEFGAMLFSRDGGMFRSSAWPLEAVADPTGAGDTFVGAMAGYLARKGRRPTAPRSCARRWCGARSSPHSPARRFPPAGSNR